MQSLLAECISPRAFPVMFLTLMAVDYTVSLKVRRIAFLHRRFADSPIRRVPGEVSSSWILFADWNDRLDKNRRPAQVVVPVTTRRISGDATITGSADLPSPDTA